MSITLETSENIDTLPKGDYKFLFWMVTNKLIVSKTENHSELADSSNFGNSDELIAGVLSVLSSSIFVKANGSIGLEIGTKHAQPVVDYLKSISVQRRVEEL